MSLPLVALVLAAPVTLTVNDYAAGDGPPGLVSNGIPFKPGELTNLNALRVFDGPTEVATATKVLARWPGDGSIRVALVQFSGTAKGYTFDTAAGMRTTTPGTLQPVTWRFPRLVATLPAAYLSGSYVMWEQKPLGTSAWDLLQTSRFNVINTEPVAANVCARTDQYYDSANSSYGIYVRSGQLQHLVNGRRWAHHHGRRQIYLTGTNVGHGNCPGGYVDNTRYTFVDSLVRDYFFWGDEESLRVAGLVVDNFYLPHAASWYYKAPNTRGFWTEREAAFAQLGLLAYYEATGTPMYLDRVRTRVHELKRMQADNGNRAWVHNLYDHDPSEGCGQSDWGTSSFMSGLLFESLIRYHKLTCDPAAAESLRWAIDDLRARNVATGDYAGRSLIYLSCPQTNGDYVDGMPDLDNLVSQGWAYAYRIGGFTRTADRDFALALMNTAVDDGYVGAPKQYNQAFRSSGHTVAYLDPTIAPAIVCGTFDGGTGGTGGGSGGTAGGTAGSGGTAGGTGSSAGGSGVSAGGTGGTAGGISVTAGGTGGTAGGGEPAMTDPAQGCGCSAAFAPGLMAAALLLALRRERRRSRRGRVYCSPRDEKT
ncbi:MAG: hypothetical protein JNK82_20855 [Myxococcaceae bacterium]|nr:hypothetical protein [Myxococcaceae bacterium]